MGAGNYPIALPDAPVGEGCKPRSGSDRVNPGCLPPGVISLSGMPTTEWLYKWVADVQPLRGCAVWVLVAPGGEHPGLTRCVPLRGL